MDEGEFCGMKNENVVLSVSKKEGLLPSTHANL